LAITIREVARHSQVSISTASRALNGRLDVSKDVRARVLAAAQELNYAANLHARALRGTTTKTLGVVLHDTRALTFNAALMNGIYEAATPRGYSVTVFNAAATADGERRGHQMLLEKRVDGILLNSALSGAEPLRRLVAEGVPFVLVNRRMDRLDLDVACDSVFLDYERGSYLATRHLLELGHRHILYQLGPRDHVPSLERLPGYRHALEEYGVPWAPELIVHAQGLAQTHRRVREAMSRLRPRPTAVMAYNDESALPVLKALHDLELQVPHDVSVVGQNNLNFAQFLVPPLTTVAHSAEEVGRLGAEILLQKLGWPEDEPWEARHVVCQPELIVRASTGAPIAGKGHA
jgi:LacI family transcriptional regulator